MSVISRRTIPEHLPEITRYSDDPTLASPHTLIAMIKGQPSLRRQLQDAFKRSYEWGPDRMLVSRYRNRLAVGFGQDLVWCLDPGKGMFLVVPGVQEALNGTPESGHAVEYGHYCCLRGS